MAFIRHGQRANINLNELAGDLVGLQFIDIARGVTTEVPERGTVTQDVVRARLFTFLPDGSKAEYLGETLVFQQIIARELQAKPNDWHLGKLAQVSQSRDTTRTVYTLEAPEDPDSVFGRMESELVAAGWA